MTTPGDCRTRRRQIPLIAALCAYSLPAGAAVGLGFKKPPTNAIQTHRACATAAFSAAACSPRPFPTHSLPLELEDWWIAVGDIGLSCVCLTKPYPRCCPED